MGNGKTGAISVGSVLFLCASSCFAGEATLEQNSGITIFAKGYDSQKQNIYQNPPIVLDVNRYVYDQGNSVKEWILLQPNDPELVDLTNNIVYAVGLWENIPSTRINFGLGQLNIATELFGRDGKTIVTLAGGSYAFGGQSGAYVENVNVAGKLEPQIYEFDVVLSRQWNGPGLINSYALLSHEIGHGVGFNHSWLNQNVVFNLNGIKSRPSLMAYGLGRPQVADSGVLSADDVSLVSRLYPDFTGTTPESIHHLSSTTGAVQGVVMDSSGKTELFGANVLLLDRLTGEAITSRISGYETTKPGSKHTGFFNLNGVPPGNYDLLVTSKSDPDIVLTNARIGYRVYTGTDTVPGNADVNFDDGFAKAWVRDLNVTQGQTINVGYVLADTDRPVSDPSLVDVTVRYNGTKKYKYYWFDFWAKDASDFTHSSGQIRSRSYSAAIENNLTWVKVWGYNNSEWVVIQDWELKDFRAHRVDLQWIRPIKEIKAGKNNKQYVQAQMTQVSLVSETKGAEAHFSKVHGTKLVSYLAPGEYKYKVKARWDLNAPWFTQKSWSVLEVGY